MPDRSQQIITPSNPNTEKNINAQRELRATPITSIVQSNSKTVNSPSVAGQRIDSYNSPDFKKKCQFIFKS